MAPTEDFWQARLPQCVVDTSFSCWRHHSRAAAAVAAAAAATFFFAKIQARHWSCQVLSLIVALHNTSNIFRTILNTYSKSANGKG